MTTDPGPDPLLELRGVSKTYGDADAATVVTALRQIDLRIDRGEAVALLGPSGSGKSTLLQLLGCLDTPSAGELRVEGRAVQGLDRNQLADLRNQKIGFVFQRFHLMPRLQAWQNVALPLRLAGRSEQEQRQRADQLLAQVGLEDRRSHRPAELSGGQQQRVAIARALANQPPILLADEPTGNLDSRSGAEVMELLFGLHAAGQTLVMVTHDEAIARRMPRVLRLLDGAVVADG